MLSHGGTIIDENGTALETSTPDERWDFVLWSLIAFALGMLSAWIGALAWIVVRFLTT